MTVTGVVAEGGGPVLRSGARRGDLLFLTGPVGASAAGLRTLRAQGRLRAPAGRRRPRRRWSGPTGDRGPGWPRARRPAGAGPRP